MRKDNAATVFTAGLFVAAWCRSRSSIWRRRCSAWPSWSTCTSGCRVQGPELIEPARRTGVPPSNYLRIRTIAPKGTSSTPAIAAGEHRQASLTQSASDAFKISATPRRPQSGGPGGRLARSIGSRPIAFAALTSPASRRRKILDHLVAAAACRSVSISAMPMAPPVFRIRLNNPLTERLDFGQRAQGDARRRQRRKT